MKSTAENVYRILGSDLFERIYDGTREGPLFDVDASSNPCVLGIHEDQRLVTCIYRNLKGVLNTLNQVKNGTISRNVTEDGSGDVDLESFLDEHLINFINKGNCGEIGVTDYPYCDVKTDKSLKGSVDVLLQPLLRLLLKTEEYVTTSSCSGRISIFENSENDLILHSKGQNIYGRSGRILFSSHCHIVGRCIDDINNTITSHVSEKHMCYKNKDTTNCDANLAAHSNIVQNSTNSDVDYNAEKQVVIKFEPFLLHMECKDIHSAFKLLHICKTSGLKQSGIISNSKRVVVAIRGTPILESPILHRYYKETKDENGDVTSQIFRFSKWLISSSYFEYLINMCNQKLTQNVRQIVRLYWKCREEFASKLSDLASTENAVDTRGEITLAINDGTECVMNFNTFGKNIESIPSLRRYKCCTASNGRFVCLFGGYSRGNTNDIALFDLRNVSGGFKLVQTQSGPECFRDTSIVSDKYSNFIVVGGRTSLMNLSSTVWILQVHDDMQINWVKCRCEDGTSFPKPRFRHAICLKETEAPSTVFYLVGGVCEAQPLDKGLMNDVWEGIIDFTYKDGILVDAIVKWVRLSGTDSDFAGWCSGTIFHSVGLNSIVIVGGYFSHNDAFYTKPSYIKQMYAFNLSSSEFSKIDIRPAGEFIPKRDFGSSDFNQYPLGRISHSMIKISPDEFIILGGLVSGYMINDIWYLNTKHFFWYFMGTIPPIDTRARCGFTLVDFVLDGCKHKELWIFGGASMICIFATHFDPPTRIILSCSRKCRNPSLFEMNTKASVLCITRKDVIKKAKEFLEKNKLFDKTRKIVCIDGNVDSIARIHLSNGTRTITSCDILDNNIRALIPITDINVEIINSMDDELRECVFFDAQNCIFQANLMELEQLEPQKQRNDICSQLKTLVTKILNGSTENITFPKKYDKVGGAVIFPKNEIDTVVDALDDSAWNLIAEGLGASSIGVINEIVGEKRIPELELLFGNGDVKQKENGVYYTFNITRNMFCSGNGTERIRIPRMYFGYPDVGKEMKYPEIVVDLFCGIGYFMLPLLKHTDTTQVRQVFACDLNKDAIDSLKLGIGFNNIQEDRVVTYVGNSECFGVDFGLEFVDKAHRVFLGLIPSSECAWESSLRAINKVYGGIIHVHGVSERSATRGVSHLKTIKSSEDWPGSEDTATLRKSTKEEMWKTRFPQHVLKSFHKLCKSTSIMKKEPWNLKILHVESVKKYSPHKYHLVVDLEIKPCRLY